MGFKTTFTVELLKYKLDYYKILYGYDVLLFSNPTAFFYIKKNNIITHYFIVRKHYLMLNENLEGYIIK